MTDRRRTRRSAAAHVSRRTSWFTRFAKHAARLTGRPITFGLAVGIVVLWAVLGPVLGFSTTWQLAINTFTTIVTFLMVFLIQNTQNRDSEAMQLKLDEIIRSLQGARNETLDLEELEEEELDRLRQSYEELAGKARDALRKKR